MYEVYRIQGHPSQDVGIMLERLYNRVVFADTRAAVLSGIMDSVKEGVKWIMKYVTVTANQ